MKYILFITASFIISWAWLMLPASREFSPFPFYKFKIPVQNYAFYLGERLIYIVLSWVVFELAQDFKFELKVIFFLFVGYAIDYVLVYNQPYGWLKGASFVATKPDGFFIPLSYSLLMGLALIILSLIAWMKS